MLVHSRTGVRHQVASRARFN